MTATDVTELINAKSQIEQARRTLERMVLQAPVAMCILGGPDYRIEVGNAKVFEIWGITPKFLNKPVFEALPQVKEEFEPLLNEVYYDGKALTFEEQETQLFRDGKLETVYLNFSYQPIRELGGEISAILAVAIDVTPQVVSRKKIEEAELNTKALNEELTSINEELSEANEKLISANFAIQESEERFKLAVENTEAGVFDTNLITGRTIRSLRHAEIYGYNDISEEWTIEKMKGHIFPADLAAAWENYSLSFRTGKLNNEFRIKRLDGAVRWINVVGRVSYNEENQPVRILGTVTDITERKELQKQKDQFISTVSHELKTPITSIKAYSQFLQRSLKGDGNEKNLNFLERMQAQINSLERLIRDLLDATRVEAGRLRMNFQKTSMNTVVANVISDLQLITPTHRLILIQNNPISINADRERIVQVITNFITNAVKYSPMSDTVNISLTMNGSDMVFAVQDFGKGIPKEHHQEVFERFHQVNTSDVNLGLGLGLYISKEIITKHGGKIWFESEVGKGSTFYFSLPCC